MQMKIFLLRSALFLTLMLTGVSCIWQTPPPAYLGGELAKCDLTVSKCDGLKLDLLHGKKFPARLQLNANSAMAYFNGVPVIMPEPATADAKKVWLLPQRSVELALKPLLAKLRPQSIRTVMLDPGHGGRDHGAIGKNGTREKNLNLALALAVGKKLAEKGFKVIYTRENDKSVPLGSRGSNAASSGADLFVSIHHNASPSNPAASGVETYALLPKAAAPIPETVKSSVYLAYLVQKEQAAMNGSFGRGVKFANFRVLRDSAVPAILIEAGFVSNPAEELRCASQEYQQMLALAIVRAIVQFASL